MRLAYAMAPEPQIAGQPWAQGVTVTGSPVVADAGNPNAFAPVANRILNVKFAVDGVLFRPNLGRLATLVLGGTSVAYTTWYYDNVLVKWVQFGPAAATTAAASVALLNVGSLMIPGIQWFAQITTVTGAVTSFRYTFT
jgi:hypothetical protein